MPGYDVVRVTAAESKRMDKNVYSGLEAPVHEVFDRHRRHSGWEIYGVTNVQHCDTPSFGSFLDRPDETTSRQ